MKEYNYDSLDNIDYAKALVRIQQKDNVDLNDEIREVRQRLIKAEEQIRKLKKLYYLRLSELIKETE